MIEKIIFNLLAFFFFIVIFFKLVRKNDTSYLSILGIQFIGIAINFIELISQVHLNLFFRILIYLLSVALPIAILLIEYYKKVSFPEIFHTTMARILEMAGNNEEARRHLIILLNKYPNSYIGHQYLAKIYEKEGKVFDSIHEYEKAIEINGNDLSSYYKIGNLYANVNRREEAAIVLQELITKKPDYYEASMRLGDVLYEEERFKEAISVYQDALKYKPADYDLYYQLGMTYTRINDFQKAKESYETAAELNTLLYHAKYNLGQIALIYGDLEEAEKFFMQSLNGKDVESGSYYYLAQIAMLKGQLDKAVSYANVAIEDTPQMYEMFQKEPIFLPIMNKIQKPESREKRKSVLTKKEIETQKHLTNTYSLVGKLNNSDIQMMKNIKKQRNKQENQGMQREN